MFWGFIGLVCHIWICLFVSRFYCFSANGHCEFEHIFVLYEYYCVCTVVMLRSVTRWLGAQDKCLYRTIKYILSRFIRLLGVMVMFSLSQASWGRRICEDIRPVVSCCVLICQALPDERGHYTWCQRHVLPWRLPLVSQTGHRGFLLICLISVYFYLYSPFKQQSHHFTDML